MKEETMAKYKIVVTDWAEYDNLDNERRILSQLGDVEVLDYFCKSEEEILPLVADCDALIAQFGKITSSVIDAMQKCKVICRYGIGTDGTDIPAATAKNICVCNVNDYCRDEVSTHALAFLLDANRRITQTTQRLKGGEWYKLGIEIPSLQKSTVGIISFGRIARATAEKLRPFCENIWAVDKYVDDEVMRKEGVTPKTTEEILAGADYIIIHAPLTDETFHMFSKEAFKKMKPTSTLINVGRGAIVDTDDLVWALENKEIGYACIDVFEKEPLDKDHPILKMENVSLTPHRAWHSNESQKTLQSAPAEEIVRVLTGKKPVNLVNKELEKLFD